MKSSPNGSGAGSMSSFYLQKLLSVTQDRSGNKDEIPTGRQRKSSKINPFGPLSTSMHDVNLSSHDLFRQKETTTKPISLLSSEGSNTQNNQLGLKIKSAQKPQVKVQNFEHLPQSANNLGYFGGLPDRSKRSSETKDHFMKISSKSYYLPVSSPHSEKGMGSLNNSASKEGDYSGIESKPKIKDFESNQDDKGMIDKFSKWIKRLGPKY